MKTRISYDDRALSANEPLGNPNLKKFILNVESVPNWRADQAAAFASLGLSDKRRAFFASLREGDVIVTYVKATGFTDVREIAVPGVTKLGLKGQYPEGAWPWQVCTRLVASVGLDRAISPNDFPNTKLCAGQWRYRFQLSGKLIDAKDGQLIADAIIRIAQNARRA